MSLSMTGDASRGTDGLTITNGIAELRRGRFLGLPIFNNIRGVCQKLMRLTPFGDSLDQQANLVFRMSEGEIVLERGVFADPLATMNVRRARIARPEMCPWGLNIASCEARAPRTPTNPTGLWTPRSA